MRLFFALALPAEVQAVLGRVRPEDAGRDYKWVEPALLHVTLAFLGEQPEARLPALRQAGEAAASASRAGSVQLGPVSSLELAQAGSLELGRVGSFPPHSGAPRVLWVGLEGDLAALYALQEHLASGLRQAGFALEDRPFRPHITLARRRASAQGGAPRGWPPPPFSNGTSIPMDQLSLFESRLSPRGPSYRLLLTFPVEPAAATPD